MRLGSESCSVSSSQVLPSSPQPHNPRYLPEEAYSAVGIDFDGLRLEVRKPADFLRRSSAPAITSRRRFSAFENEIAGFVAVVEIQVAEGRSHCFINGQPRPGGGFYQIIRFRLVGV